MQASDDFTTHTERMIDNFHSCKLIEHSITNHEKFVDVFNPSTRSYGKVDVDVLMSSDGVYHVAISLPSVDVWLGKHSVDEDLAFKKQKLDQEIICRQVKDMFDGIHEIFTTDEGYEVSWFVHDREDAYENYQGCLEGEGLMVVVLKPI